MLFIGTDEWLDDAGSVYNELMEANPKYRVDIPIITVVPRGSVLDPDRRVWPGCVAVRWHAGAIIAAVRANAIPATLEDLRLTRQEGTERAKIVPALERHDGRHAAAARALRITSARLRLKRMEYLIR